MDTRDYEAQLASTYKYHKLDTELSARVRDYYKANIPEFLNTSGDDKPIFSMNGSQIAKRYDRIVIGDYGAFIEFSNSDSMKFDYIVEHGQEYRIVDPKYKNNVKYDWYTIDDGSHVKIYHQKKSVVYADYEVGKYYVSVHEVKIMRKVLFTHIDMDGAGSELIVRLANPDIEVYRVDYNFDLDIKYRKIMAEADSLIFTDISVSRDTAELLEATRRYGKELLLLDHHESAKNNLGDLNYPWVHIDMNYSGALLAFCWYKSQLSLDYQLADYNNYGYLAMLISDYDLWTHEHPESIILQFLWNRLGTDAFVDRFLKNSSPSLSAEEKMLVKESEEALEESYQIAISHLEEEEDIEGNKWLLITDIGQMYSLVASRILKERQDVVYCCIMSRKGSLSFRSKSYDIEPIARALGGGGHKLAAGAPQVELMDVISSVNYREVTTYPFC